MAAVAIIAASITSCGKYEEGPKLSLRSKKGRLAGDWLLQSVEVNGTAVNFTNSDYWTFDKDGTYKYTAGNLSVSGTWVFTDDKLGIITEVSGNKDTMSTLIKLTNKEMWFKDVDGANTTITKMKAKE